ncbi:hypothetical protein ERO13_A03G059266v2 [Gossypium hirsutum]|uniref:NADP-dependent oxidoreductase domain-containing protein n=2 Tax=Gossypium TaxID=3633 RepID=A0A5J5WC83_GOSBA|nr:hypothetical protein ES319_A03G070900v1 [Gossypium barbadense]KAG4207320.1 hypothetical protein ERO13_A03G059266v2 [Gossypium hirsutum]TYI35477.1 hypothetical protein ES332_A03G079200v1 [Gossypium tomentosum]
MRKDEVRLNCGITIPVIGLGTYSSHNDRVTTEKAVHSALKMGYRHFDAAKIYGSEGAVGNALRMAIEDQIIPREDVFLTSKLWSGDHHDPVSALKHTLRNLGMEYIDMYLVHWPIKLKPWACNAVPKEEDFEKQLDMETTWEGMQKCLDLGLCRCIGVEMHPMWRQRKLREICGKHDIHVSGYSPLGGPGNAWGSTAVVKNPLINSIALKYKATPAQVALKWGLTRGASVIVKSFNPDRLRENMGSLDLKLDDEDLIEIEQLEERKIMRGDFLVNNTTSPYKTLEELWDSEI